MSKNARYVVVLSAMVSLLAITSVAASPALADIPYVFKDYAVSGSLTVKKLNEPVVLPKHSTFNGVADFNALPPTPGWSAVVSGALYVPPFEAQLKLAGIVPGNVGVTFTEVGHSEGTIAEAPAADCPNPVLPGPCALMSVTSKAIIGISGVGLIGVNLPTQCETSEPVTFALSTYLTFEELKGIGPHFNGTTTIPSIVCGGLDGPVLGPLITALMSGPENPYAFYIAPHEPALPVAEVVAASATSQVSALMNGRVNPEGATLTACRFEYGTSTASGTSVPCQPPLSTIHTPFAGSFVYGQAANLNENTVYHYKVVVTNSLGTTSSPEETFTTGSFAGGPTYGQCVPQKHGEYADEGCLTVSASKGVPNHKGGFEWHPGAASSCAAQKKGEYTDSSCTTKSAKAKKGGFERQPGPGYTTSSGSVTLEVPELGRTVKCAASSGTGEVTGPITATQRITLTGCEAGGKKCTSEGPNSTPSGKSGAIVTNLLNTRPLSSSTEGVWTELTSGEHQPYAAEFACEGVRFRVTGSLAGIQEGNVATPSLTSTTSFAFTHGEQALYTAVAETSGESWGTPQPTIVTTLATNTAASPTEIRP